MFADKFVFFWQTNYKFDRNGNWITVSESYGFAGGSDVNLSVSANLTSAAVSAAVDLTTCTVDRRGNFNCVDAGIGSVSASWTGQGDTIKQSGSYHVVSKGFTSNSTYRQTSRNAIPSELINRAAIGGQSIYASIFNSTNRDIFICHGPGTC